MNTWHTMMSSPVGDLKIVAGEDHLLAILWTPDRPRRVMLPESVERDEQPILRQTRVQLGEYFAGTRSAFDVPIRFNGTLFQHEVWHALLKIRNGETWSYQRLAQFVGRPKASRAVGAAVGRNPVSIIVPCHRVVGSRGELTGFAGGLPAKQLLLGLERSGPYSGFSASQTSETDDPTPKWAFRNLGGSSYFS